MNRSKLKSLKTRATGNRTKVIVPKGFETLKTVRILRDKITKNKLFSRKFSNCSLKEPCGNICCPLCNRSLRINLLKFAVNEKLPLLKWSFVTIRLSGQFRDPGDASQYSCFKSNRQFKQIIQRLRRAHDKMEDSLPLLIIGAFEAPYKTVENIPVKRQLHVHFLVSGLDAKAILDSVSFIEETSSLNDTSLKKVDVKPVEHQLDDFILALSYAVKQPVIKHSFINKDSQRPIHQMPNNYQISELLQNFGLKRKCTDRLFLVGFRVVNFGFKRLK